MELSVEQQEELRHALLSGFRSDERLKDFLQSKCDLDVRLHLGPIAGLERIARVAIELALEKGRIVDFVRALKQERPNNSLVERFDPQVVIRGDDLPDRGALERMVDGLAGMNDALAWYNGMGPMLGRVCRITVLGYCGTGFLLGPDLVLTNFHVLEPVIPEREGGMGQDPKSAVFKFEPVDGGGGDPVGLSAGKWLLACAPPSAVDNQVRPRRDPDPEELDFALVRLRERVGDGPRGWIVPPLGVVATEKDKPMVILQYPASRPLTFAIDTRPNLVENRNKTRLRYRTNTEGGSSGSPCFDMAWNLVAVHHWGDPNLALGHKPTFNQGIPFELIRQKIAKRIGGRSVAGAKAGTTAKARPAGSRQRKAGS